MDSVLRLILLHSEAQLGRQTNGSDVSHYFPALQLEQVPVQAEEGEVGVAHHGVAGVGEVVGVDHQLGHLGRLHVRGPLHADLDPGGVELLPGEDLGVGRVVPVTSDHRPAQTVGGADQPPPSSGGEERRGCVLECRICISISGKSPTSIRGKEMEFSPFSGLIFTFTELQKLKIWKSR